MGLTAPRLTAYGHELAQQRIRRASAELVRLNQQRTLATQLSAAVQAFREKRSAANEEAMWAAMDAYEKVKA